MVYREPQYCLQCNEPLKPRYGDMGKSFVGDTFLGYEPCKCQQAKPAEKDKDSEVDLWEKRYRECRALLQELVYLKSIKGIAESESEYEERKPLAWAAAKIFLGNNH